VPLPLFKAVELLVTTNCNCPVPPESYPNHRPPVASCAPPIPTKVCTPWDKVCDSAAFLYIKNSILQSSANVVPKELEATLKLELTQELLDPAGLYP